MIETTPLVISFEGALAIAASVMATGFFIWKASSDAHKDIRDQLCTLRVRMTEIGKDVEWLVRLQGGTPYKENDDKD